MNIYLDIETMPTTDADTIAAIAASIKPPASYKNAEKIAEWERENKPALIDNAVAKTSFDGICGRIACVCYALDDGPVHEQSAADEAELLDRLYVHLAELLAVRHHDGRAFMPVTVVGHNVASFDLPFLKHRSIINDVRPCEPMLAAMKAKPWDERINDTMLMWSAEREKRVSLDLLCRALGIAGKSDFDGSMVAETWPTDPQKVIDYCKADVERVRAIHRRLTFASLPCERHARAAA